MKCLIVEDDFISRRILNNFLAQHFECDVAANGEEAVTACRQALESGCPYDLICMDIMMQHMDGQEALNRIRDIEQEMLVDAGAAVKVIMTTSLNDPKTMMDAFHTGGASAYLVKPVSKQQLMTELKNLNLIL